MHVVINCLGLPFNGDTVAQSSLGGSESAAYYMAKELAASGHLVTVFTASQEEGVFDNVRYIYAGEQHEHAPLGERFHHYATNTPHDVLIIQRHPLAFHFKWASKINLWWVHDMPTERMKQQVLSMMWNVDGVLTVSEYHKELYVSTYELNPEKVFVVRNGIDRDLFRGELTYNLPEGASKQYKLLYSHRPERGLEHLVAPGGIMERLLEEDPGCHLYVCGYENTTKATRDYYQWLWSRCDELPNVTNLGALTKQDLASVMHQCDLHVYPTPGPHQSDFVEVSCITAMEAAAAGLPFLSSYAGALPETCANGGVKLLLLNDDGMPDREAFVREIKALHADGEGQACLYEEQLHKSADYDWVHAASDLNRLMRGLLGDGVSSGAIARDLLRHSDIYALQEYLRGCTPGDYLVDAVRDELEECYGFMAEKSWADHYRRYYDNEAERGAVYGPEDMRGNERFEHVSIFVSGHQPGALIIDYGCAHGHYTINLAKRFPQYNFVGIDIEPSNIQKARQWAEQEGLSNVAFVIGSVDDENGVVAYRHRETKLPEFARSALGGEADCVIAAEVLEHVATPGEHADVLRHRLLKDGGLMIITVPFGPWEAQSFEETWPFRAHVYHFDRQDLRDMWGHMPGFGTSIVPSGMSKWQTPLGSYVVTFRNDKEKWTGKMNVNRKLEELHPRQTMSLCMIAKDAQSTILRTLESVVDVADEVVVGLDPATTDHTREVLQLFADTYHWPKIHVFDLSGKVLDTGFDRARNETLARAYGDWIMWMDADEVLVNPLNLTKYLRNNGFQGYAVKQHHASVNPLGILKTDYPCRLFRNHRGIQFYGMVHEHPEKSLNLGIGHVSLLPDVEIFHDAYLTEDIRRRRFQRNIGLMERDRQENPDRFLGKMLWIRDLAQLSRYELEYNGGQVTPAMRRRAEEGVELWRDLVRDRQTRLAVDGLEYYDTLSQLLGSRYHLDLTLQATEDGMPIGHNHGKQISSHFATREDAQGLMDLLYAEEHGVR